MPTHWDSQPHFTDEKIEAGRKVEGDMAHATQLAIGGGCSTVHLGMLLLSSH